MTGPRPAVVVLVAGTGTDVGKTWVAARLLETWRVAGLSVAARKPAQSFAEGAGPTDAEVLGAASGEEPATVCRPGRSYRVPLAPPMAADALGLPPPTLADLVGELAWPPAGTDVGLVEMAGGVRSPQADDGDTTDMVRAIGPDGVVLVADAGLGTVNAVRLSVRALTDVRRDGRPPLVPVVVLNRFDASSDLHRRNLAWLRDRDGACVLPATPDGLGELARRTARERPDGTARDRPDGTARERPDGTPP
ncbi:MAG TPA: dethiobiotin synthase [Acidimicrobiales bacterium]|nr:dethiobiotin synthase [Acidimicrobiales bacterium]